VTSKDLRRDYTNSLQSLPEKSLPSRSGGTILNSLYEATITLIPKPDKIIKRKVNYRPISLTNKDVEIFSKY